MTTLEQDIDRVAKAIYEHGAEEGNDACTWEYALRIAEKHSAGTWADQGRMYQDQIDECRGKARAAIDAMPDPAQFDDTKDKFKLHYPKEPRR